jgi:acyl-CoA reductase-like NAD-dependent aldehyde dehydrogenase
VDEGAQMVFDVCNPEVKKGYDNGSFVGATIITHVKPHMHVAHLACLCCCDA